MQGSSALRCDSALKYKDAYLFISRTWVNGDCITGSSWQSLQLAHITTVSTLAIWSFADHITQRPAYRAERIPVSGAGFLRATDLRALQTAIGFL
jgi:hypothetical protein